MQHRSERKISTGSYELNKFLFGGYETDVITTIYGPGGSGKTNFCMILSASQAKKGNKIIYIDTEGGFSIDRFKQLTVKNDQDKENFDKYLKNILLLKPTSFDEQKESFAKLLKHVKKENISLIIVDSIAMLYRLELADAIKLSKEEELETGETNNEQIKQVNRKLAAQLRILNEIARKQNIPVVVTNQVYSEFKKDQSLERYEKKISMVGGDLLKYWSKCLMELSIERGGKRKLILRKHRSLPEKELDFEITSSGIRKKGLF